MLLIEEKLQSVELKKPWEKYNLGRAHDAIGPNFARQTESCKAKADIEYAPSTIPPINESRAPSCKNIAPFFLDMSIVFATFVFS